MALGTAFRAFFGSLFNSETSARVQAALDGEDATEQATPRIEAPQPAGEPAAAKPPARSEALTLLAALQREARLVDLMQEKLEQFSDAQVGAAARPCLQQSAAVLERVFALAPVVEQAEGERVAVPEDASPAAYQWIGEGQDPTGQVVHPGWRATRVDLPQWTGRDSDARIIAPAQVKR
ncbi:DUF2760 domain-containing protein [Roseimaritima sediminicola]|uniref:DUF2760 domain-containing protein n=1 Tax=Roseimaritima sediminicola TaxID=2662066 RepID=UPI00129857FF|nr:DUF2760 domain-containing protein [Roseimaritima sediminicola]